MPAHSTVQEALVQLLAEQKALKLATAGGVASPWITGTYFAERGPYTLNLTLEKRGKGLANILASPTVALAVDSNNPFARFAQGKGRARILEGAEAEAGIVALKRKVPEIEPLLRGEFHVMAIDMTEWLLTSFPDGWFPAKSLTPGA